MYEAKEEVYYPLKAEYNSQLDELIVCTTRVKYLYLIILYFLLRMSGFMILKLEE